MQVFQEKHSLPVKNSLGCGSAFNWAPGMWSEGPWGSKNHQLMSTNTLETVDFTRRWADVERETSLNVFYEALKHLMCLIFKYLLCLLRDKDAILHSGL